MSSLRKPEELFKWLTEELGFTGTEPLRLSQFTRLCRGSLHLLLHLLSIHLLGIAPTSRIRSELHRLQTLSLSNQLSDSTRSLLFPSDSDYATYHRTHAQTQQLDVKLAKAQKTLTTNLILLQNQEKSRHDGKADGVKQSVRLKMLEETKNRWLEGCRRLEKLGKISTARSGTTTQMDQPTLQKAIDLLSRSIDPTIRSRQRLNQCPALVEPVNICDLIQSIREWITEMNQKIQKAECQDIRSNGSTLELDHLSDTLFDLHRLHIEFANHFNPSGQSLVSPGLNSAPAEATETPTSFDRRSHRRSWEEKLRIKLEDRFPGDPNKVHKKMNSILRRVQDRVDSAFQDQINQTTLKDIMGDRPAGAVDLSQLRKVQKGREERRLYLDALDVQWRKITKDVYSLLHVLERVSQHISQHARTIDETHIIRDEVFDTIRLSTTELKNQLEIQVSQFSHKEGTDTIRPPPRPNDVLKEEVFGNLADLTFKEKLSIMERALHDQSNRTMITNSIEQCQEAVSVARSFSQDNPPSSTEDSQSMKWSSELKRLRHVLNQRSIDVKQANEELRVYKHEMGALMSGKLNQRGKKVG